MTPVTVVIDDLDLASFLNHEKDAVIACRSLEDGGLFSAIVSMAENNDDQVFRIAVFDPQSLRLRPTEHPIPMGDHVMVAGVAVPVGTLLYLGDSSYRKFLQERRLPSENLPGRCAMRLRKAMGLPDSYCEPEIPAERILLLEEGGEVGEDDLRTMAFSIGVLPEDVLKY